MEVEPIPPSHHHVLDPLVALQAQARNPCHEVVTPAPLSSPPPAAGQLVGRTGTPLPPPPPLKASPAALAAGRGRGIQRQLQPHLGNSLLHMAAAAATAAMYNPSVASPSLPNKGG